MKRHQLRRGILAATFVAALIAAGCGGDDDDNGNGVETSDLSKQEWIAQADEICSQGDKEIEAQAGEFFGGGQPKPAQIERFSEQVALPSLEEQVADLKALGAPEGDEEEVGAIISAAEDGLVEARQDPSRLEAGALDEATRLVRDYGVQTCGGGE